jgi:tryptophanyl-tRNA synthetase
MQPTGDVHLGNYLGALRNWAAGQHTCDAFHGIVDLHALTVTDEPGVLGRQTMSLAAMFFAIGLDPDVATVFVQSHVPEHNQLGWIMECTVSFGELSRMTQFKDKSAKREHEFVSAGLFTYPALQAADIVLYDANEVPIGDDQRQHVEITRDIAIRFNHRFGETFVVPEAVTPAAGARVMSLQDPTSKMSKSDDSDAGCVYLIDEPGAVMKKFKRAVTDSDTGPDAVRYDRAEKPGVANLLEIHRCGHGSHAAGGRRRLRAVRQAQGRHRRGGPGAARPDSGALPRAARRPRRTRTAAARRCRQGSRGRLGHARTRPRQHRPPPHLNAPSREQFHLQEVKLFTRTS